MRVLLLAALLVACHKDRIEAPRFTVYASGAGCVVVADLVSQRDSSNVDLQLKACKGDRCSAPSNRNVAEGPFAPGRAKTVSYQLGDCPPEPDRIDIEVTRWGSPTNGLPTGVVDHVDKVSEDGGCRLDASVHVDGAFGDSLSILVGRDAAGKPLDRSLPFSVPKSGPHRETWRTATPCDRIATLELQPVT